MELIAVPSNLGLRPPSPGHEPGTWRAPRAMLGAGLDARLAPKRLVELDRPSYEFEAQSGTRIRNGLTIREHALLLADAVESALSAGRFRSSSAATAASCSAASSVPGARGRCGLVHVDGHIDSFHPGNYDTASRLGSVAGMDLALATGAR
jgi:arginase